MHRRVVGVALKTRTTGKPQTAFLSIYNMLLNPGSLMLYEMHISILYEMPFGYPFYRELGALDVVEDVQRAFYRDLWCHRLVAATLHTRSMSV